LHQAARPSHAGAPVPILRDNLTSALNCPDFSQNSPAKRIVTPK
jgi:hypothetical protein